ncbi:hypothetical protein GCM10020218_004130 [Dactylosporangium vinaceum]
MIEDAQLLAMSPQEREELARRLAALRTRPGNERARRRFVIVIGVASVLMIPWMIALAIRLPPQYLAGKLGPDLGRVRRRPRGRPRGHGLGGAAAAADRRPRRAGERDAAVL